MYDFKRYFFVLLSVISVVSFVGCGTGGGQGLVEAESPEAAVNRIANSWKASGSAPQIVVDKNNLFLHQASRNEFVASSSQKTIRLTDLDNNTYVLLIKDIQINRANSTVRCHYVYESGYLNLVFNLVYDEQKWWMDSVDVTDNSASYSSPSLSGYVIDVSGAPLYKAKVVAFDIEDPNTAVYSTVTDSNGYYEMSLPSGTYTIVASKDGYVQTKTVSVSLTSPSHRPTANVLLNRN